MSLEGAGEFLDLEIGEVEPGLGIESGEITSWRCVDDAATRLNGASIDKEETALELAEIGIENLNGLASGVSVECPAVNCARAVLLIEQGRRMTVASASGDCLADALGVARLGQNGERLRPS